MDPVRWTRSRAFCCVHLVLYPQNNSSLRTGILAVIQVVRTILIIANYRWRLPSWKNLTYNLLILQLQFIFHFALVIVGMYWCKDSWPNSWCNDIQVLYTGTYTNESMNSTWYIIVQRTCNVFYSLWCTQSRFGHVTPQWSGLVTWCGTPSAHQRDNFMRSKCMQHCNNVN